MRFLNGEGNRRRETRKYASPCQLGRTDRQACTMRGGATQLGAARRHPSTHQTRTTTRRDRRLHNPYCIRSYHISSYHFLSYHIISSLITSSRNTYHTHTRAHRYHESYKSRQEQQQERQNPNKTAMGGAGERGVRYPSMSTSPSQAIERLT